MSFWANKLSNGAPQAPQPIAASRDLFGMYNPVPTPAPVPEQQSTPQEYKPTARLTQGGHCPGCDSDRYMPHPPGLPKHVMSCPECGYNPTFSQTGYGEGSLQGKGAKPARQSADRQTMDGALAQLKAGGGFHMHDN